MKLIEYDRRYRQDFIDFNTAWIEDNFGHLEPEDYETFEHIEDEIKEGAMIYFVIDEDGTALATCMAKPMEGNTWELCKLGSNKERKHSGSGSMVFEAAMNWAINHGAGRLFLISNSKLSPALHIYEKYGFTEVKLADYEYERGDIAFEKVIGYQKE
ncbi:GNAT family N-acetyltransferase [Butyrivibrio sp.]|uniref:GNAT family N-acetyltransferase n=1 Tax=Butyrivibrio sp. TaxID=28121 RepID=UPI0025C246A9|nr:GNAT family N-acetyltransferase [Butyrivibrio sp.]MBQ9301509.1 GNAT family N-acetyltransferase [Butyrivibrio sp.]